MCNFRLQREDQAVSSIETASGRSFSCDTASIERSAASLEFETVWRGLRGDRGVPARADISPKKIPVKMLPGIIIQNIDDQDIGGPLQFRLAGSRLRSIAGFELTGSTLPQAITEQSRRYRRCILSAI